MSGIRVNEWLHNSGTGGIWQTSAGNVGIASSVPTTKLEVTGDAKVSGVCTATAFIPSGGQLSHRNLIVNGAMMVAQRSTSTTDQGYCTVDRFGLSNNGLDEATTNSQHDLTSSDAGPWEEGFRHSLHIQNGNHTGGAGVDDRISIYYKPEAQDIANSGWNYASTSSYITLSFWVKSSVAQNFYFFLRTDDGTQMNYVMETGSLSANTWKKVTKIIPGNTNLTFTDDNGVGAVLEWTLFRGTNKTGTRALNTWEAYDSSVRVPDMTSTWYTTNDATFEITGVQLEVGQAATPFEHISRGEDLHRCSRYCQVMTSNATSERINFADVTVHGAGNGVYIFPHLLPMRTAPSITTSGSFVASVITGSWTTTALSSITSEFTTANGNSRSLWGFDGMLSASIADSCTVGLSGQVFSSSGYGQFVFSAEL